MHSQHSASYEDGAIIAMSHVFNQAVRARADVTLSQGWIEKVTELCSGVENIILFQSIL